MVKIIFLGLKTPKIWLPKASDLEKWLILANSVSMSWALKIPPKMVPMVLWHCHGRVRTDKIKFCHHDHFGLTIINEQAQMLNWTVFPLFSICQSKIVRLKFVSYFIFQSTLVLTLGNGYRQGEIFPVLLWLVYFETLWAWSLILYYFIFWTLSKPTRYPCLDIQNFTRRPALPP